MRKTALCHDRANWDVIGRRFLLALLVASVLPGCGASERPLPAPGVSLELADLRKQSISDPIYTVQLSIPAAPDAPIRGRERVDFKLFQAESVALDFQQPPEALLSLKVNGREVPSSVQNEHIVIDRELREGRNQIDLEFIAGSGSLNRREDLLYTLFVPDRASIAFPCFDQPDLKARLRLELLVPEGWQAVSNQAAESEQVADGVRRISFMETAPLSTYLFAFAAGKFEVETARLGDRTFRMFHRETDGEKVARNRGEIFSLHARALDWLEEYTGIPYPFQKFDFVLLPGFQFGGMEHPGAIFYRDGGLMLDESHTRNELLGRASLISHETAHMWFGDLVTMKWFNDVWTKEVFANFMAAKLVRPLFPEVDFDHRFYLSHYPSAYEIDRTEGANPIRQPLENLKDAGTLYGAIIYQKAPVVMRQLEILTGAEGMREGLRAYLKKFSYSNATWPELIRILSAYSSRDLEEWNRVWVTEAGRPRLRAVPLIGDDGVTKSIRVEQADPFEQGRIWPQPVDLAVWSDGRTEQREIFLEGASAEVPDSGGFKTPVTVLPGARGVAYGEMVLDQSSLENLLQALTLEPSAVSRAVIWQTVWDGMLEGRVRPDDLFPSVLSALEIETSELNLEFLCGILADLYWDFLGVPQRDAAASGAEDRLWRMLGAAESKSAKAALFRAYQSIALSSGGIGRLHAVWDGIPVEGLTFSENDYMRMAWELAVRDREAGQGVLERQASRITNPDRRREFDFVRPALSPEAGKRDAFFAGLSEPANRRPEPWVLNALRYLHHPLVAAESEKYLQQSLDWLEDIKRTGDIFFPKRWLDVSLGGHSSKTAAELVGRFLGSHPDYPAPLRRQVLQSADLLFRKVRVIEQAAQDSRKD